MRIALLSWESSYTIQVGGLAAAVSGLAEGLAKAGHEVYLFTRRAPGQPHYMHINLVHYYGCSFDWGQNILALAYNMSKAMVENLRFVERYVGKFDIIHGHDWLVVDALHDLKGDGYPLILTFHSTEYGRRGGSFGDWWEFKEISGKEWYGGYIADRITTVSNHMKNELNWLYNVPLDKIEVVPNGIDPSLFKLNVDPGRIKERYGIHPLAPLIIFVGRMEYQKGPDLLLEAIPKVLGNRWDAKFIFIGDGGMRNYLEGRANELGVGHAVKFLGFVPHPQYLEILNSCDIVCLPSRNEPFGMTLLEAWAAGRPIVATDVGGFGENIDNFNNGVKVYTNPESVAWGINYLLNSPEAMKRISERGEEKVRNFSWENVAKKMENIYSKVKRY
ncbi:MAG: glycosyltransferase family 4 protein [Candidatus Bathyarchaeia archaeon]